MPTLGKKGKCSNNINESAPAKHGRKENLTKDDIPTIVEAILNAMAARANPEPGSNHQANCSRGCLVTHRRNDTGSHHAKETSTTANETRHDNPSTADQDVDYVLSTLT